VQVVELIEELKDHAHLTDEIANLQMPMWLLDSSITKRSIPFPVATALLKLLTVFCRYYPELSMKAKDAILKFNDWNNLSYIAATRGACA